MTRCGPATPLVYLRWARKAIVWRVLPRLRTTPRGAMDGKDGLGAWGKRRGGSGAREKKRGGA
eukprot:4081532-Prymnesium_polylepis.1